MDVFGPFSDEERRRYRSRKKQQGILLAAFGFTLFLFTLPLLNVLKITHVTLRQWIILLTVTVILEFLLWLIPRRGWDVFLHWDPHYVYTPALAAAILLNLIGYAAPEIRILCLMLWFSVLVFLAGFVPYQGVLIMSGVMVAGYLLTLYLLVRHGVSVSVRLELTAMLFFLGGSLYHSLIYHRIYLERQRRIALQRQLLEFSITDPLTGLYNLREMHRRLQEEIVRSRRYEHPFCILLTDLDGFKEVNDRYGHLVGNFVLQVIADLILRNARPSDLVFRYGGDEFLILLPETGRTGAFRVAHRIRAAVAENAITVAPDIRIFITMSIGVACFSEDGTNVSELLASADRALYLAKRAGRNCVRDRYARE